MKKILHGLDNYFEEVILSIVIAYFVFATALQVVARFVLKISMPWTEETARYALIWMTFLGSAYAAKKGTHIRIDLFESVLKQYGKYLHLISFVIFLIFSGMMFVAGVSICSKLLAMPQYSSIMHWNMVVVYAALPVGMGLTFLRVLQRLWRENRKGGKEN